MNKATSTRQPQAFDRADASRVKNAFNRLCVWFDANARKLPWRFSPEDEGLSAAVRRDPYRSWVSEIMLQQTQAETVKPYYRRFIERFPNTASLAATDEEEVLKYWEGLGYYSRARHLWQAARVVAQELGGAFPQTRDDLLKLPGIGSYTAGAVASLAYGQAVPAVDGNVLRVLSRFLAMPWQRSAAASLKAAESFMADFYAYDVGPAADVDTATDAGSTADTGSDANTDAKKYSGTSPENPSATNSAAAPLNPALLNEALIELGALLCLPRQTNCDRCPLGAACRAHRAGTELSYPLRPARVEKPREYWTALLLFDRGRGRFLLEKRPPHGLLASLWQFPMCPDICEAETLRDIFTHPGMRVCHLDALPSKTHVFSHRIWELSAYYVELELSPEAERALLSSDFSIVVGAEEGMSESGHSPRASLSSATAIAAESEPTYKVVPKSVKAGKARREWVAAEALSSRPFSSALRDYRDCVSTRDGSALAMRQP